MACYRNGEGHILKLGSEFCLASSGRRVLLVRNRLSQSKSVVWLGSCEVQTFLAAHLQQKTTRGYPSNLALPMEVQQTSAVPAEGELHYKTYFAQFAKPLFSVWGKQSNRLCGICLHHKKRRAAWTIQELVLAKLAKLRSSLSAKVWQIIHGPKKIFVIVNKFLHLKFAQEIACVESSFFFFFKSPGSSRGLLTPILHRPTTMSTSFAK